MKPETSLQHLDAATLWPRMPSDDTSYGVAPAYEDALAVRALRIARGEKPQGYKIGFTNRHIWERYAVFAPIWGTVYDSTTAHCDGEGVVSLAGCSQPRLEPEVVFGMRATPPANPTLQQLFECIEWMAPGFEIVQSHLAGWKFRVADTAADGALHARLLVGRRVPLAGVASSAEELERALCATGVTLFKAETAVEQGRGANVLDGPLSALHYFLREMRACPGAPDLLAGDVVTTGTWTDAWPVAAGEVWCARFDALLGSLKVRFT